MLVFPVVHFYICKNNWKQVFRKKTKRKISVVSLIGNALQLTKFFSKWGASHCHNCMWWLMDCQKELSGCLGYFRYLCLVYLHLYTNEWKILCTKKKKKKKNLNQKKHANIKSIHHSSNNYIQLCKCGNPRLGKSLNLSIIAPSITWKTLTRINIVFLDGFLLD